MGTLLGSFEGETQGGSHRAILTPDEQYLISLDNRNGLSFAYFSQVLNANPSSSPNKFEYYLNQWWPSQVNVPAPYSFCISSDSNFLFVGVRSIGIYTIDITDKMNPLTYTWAYLPYHGNSITLSPTANYLYFSNSNSFMVFRRMKPILGQNYVNLYNGDHSLGFSQSDTRYYWRCDYDPYRQVYIGAFDTDGLWFIDVSDPTRFNVIQSSYKPPNQDSNIDVFYAFNNYQTMITSMNDGVNFMAVLDISNYSNIKVIQKIKLGLPVYGYIKDVDYNASNTFLVAAMDRVIVFLDISTIGNYYVLATWQFLPQMKGLTTGVMLSSDEKYFVGACRGYGYFVLDIQDLNNIKMVNYFESTGAEQVFKSSTFSYQYYLIDGLGGLYIMDQTALPQFKQFSQLNVPGWTNDITYLQDEMTVIIATMQQGMIYLVDISNNKNPIIISSYQYGDYNGFVSCSTQDFTKLFIDNNNEMRQLPLDVPVKFHSDYLDVLGYSESGDMLFNIINSPEKQKFLVGQTIKINFCILYQPLDIVVSSVKLFQKQRELPLPSWIVYDPIEISVTIQFTKNAVDPANIKQALLNTLVFTTIKPLESSDFVFKNGQCLTNKLQAQAIFEQLQQDGVIDEHNLISEKLQFNEIQFVQIRNTDLFPNKTLQQQIYNSCISNTTKYTLSQAVQKTPVYLFAQSSLNLIIDGSTNNYISTTANLVNIQIEIPKFSGQFIYQNSGSVNIQLNQDMNIINITGRVQNVNEFLKQKLIVYPIAPTKYQQITAVVTVSDSMNYPITKNLSAFQFPFLKEKKNIQINPDKKLQSQFSDNIYIQTYFGFTINSETFIVPDLNITISYQIQRQKGQNYVNLDSTDWLQYDSNTRLFYGTPPQNAFGTSITIQVTGTDGFTKISQEFTIHVSKIPFSLVLQWIISILGPLTGVLGLYKFRGDIYNIIYDKRNKYSQITCQPNKKFILKIPLILRETDSSIQIIQKLKKELLNIAKTKQKERTQNKQVKQIQKNNFKILSQINKIKNKLQKQFQNLQDLTTSKLSDVTQNYVKRLEKQQKSQRLNIFEEEYLKDNGQIDYDRFLDQIIEMDIRFKFGNLETTAKNQQENIKNENGSLNACLKFQLAKKLIKYDAKSLAVYNFLKYYSKVKSTVLTNNDWYKYLIKIKSTDNLDYRCNYIVFPNFQFNFSRLSEALKPLGIEIDQDLKSVNYSDDIESDSKVQKTYNDILEKNGVNMYLIEQYMFSEAAGVRDKMPSTFFPSVGESLYLDYHEIDSVAALRYQPGIFQCIEKLLNLEYKPYGPQGNIQLPNWLELDTQPGLIILKGTPSFSDTEEILIRITTTQNYTIRNFILKVEMDLNKYNQFRNSIKSKKSSSKKGKIGKKQITLQSADKELQSFKCIHLESNQENIIQQIQQNQSPNQKPQSLLTLNQNLDTQQQLDQNEQFQNIFQIQSSKQTKNSKSVIPFSDEESGSSSDSDQKQIQLRQNSENPLNQFTITSLQTQQS
ncbi:hypothetical protein ABPG74_004053 [Tetrahymena malaccensis]